MNEAGHKLKRKTMIIAFLINFFILTKSTNSKLLTFFQLQAIAKSADSFKFVYIMEYLYGFLTKYVGFWYIFSNYMHVSNFYAH